MRRAKSIGPVNTEMEQRIRSFARQINAAHDARCLLTIYRCRVLRAGDIGRGVPVAPAALDAESRAGLVGVEIGREIADGRALLEGDVGRADRFGKAAINVGIDGHESERLDARIRERCRQNRAADERRHRAPGSAGRYRAEIAELGYEIEFPVAGIGAGHPTATGPNVESPMTVLLRPEPR